MDGLCQLFLLNIHRIAQNEFLRNKSSYFFLRDDMFAKTGKFCLAVCSKRTDGNIIL